MDTWDDWLNRHWFEIGVLIGLALIVINTARIAWQGILANHNLEKINDEIGSLRSDIKSWERSWDLENDKRWMARDERNRSWRP